ncbi:dentin sialophosphoprotein-like isoform X3 [Solea solea]|uniref:dentin sialophosphoprotein-like isoform X3 n=1 Tax=Solea solea TaxID=90069 RepID=UPI00272A14FB|nr:dentin sialophosphoprotein-like isoform X3 [Solea solea]
MAKRRGPYKRYLEDDTAEIPRTTKHRWKVKNANHDDDINTDSHMSNTSTNGEEELNNSSSEDKLSNDNSSTTSVLDMDNQENDYTDNQINTQEHCSNTSNSEDEDTELNTENPTTSQLDVEISENEEALSHSEEDLTDSASNEGENHADDEDVMEGNSTREKTPEFPVGSEDQADGDKPLYPGAPVSKGESLLMLMSYVLRNNLTGKALTHLLELFNLMFPGLVPPSHYLFHKEFGSSSQSEVHFY